MSCCLECGKPLAGVRDGASFCAASCRKAWNNRRLVRGAELYDLVMAARCDRKMARTLKLWRFIWRLVSGFRDEDRRERSGRPSWRAPKDVLDQRPYLTTTITNVRAGR